MKVRYIVPCFVMMVLFCSCDNHKDKKAETKFSNPMENYYRKNGVIGTMDKTHSTFTGTEESTGRS